MSLPSSSNAIGAMSADRRAEGPGREPRSIRPCLVGGTRQGDDGIGTFATIPQVLRLLG